jgi:hypothetical protein
VTLTRALLAAAVALVVGFAVVSPAFATPYQYRDIDWVWQEVTPGSSASGTLDLVNVEGDCILGICDKGGFVPGTAEAGRMSFLIMGADRSETAVAIDLSGPDEFGVVQDLIQDFDSYNIWHFEIQTAELNASVLYSLNQEGWLNWEISALQTALAGSGFGGHTHYPGCGHDSSGFFVKIATLEAAEGVIPEPSAAILFALGAGVVGTGVRRRRTA